MSKPIPAEQFQRDVTEIPMPTRDARSHAASLGWIALLILVGGLSYGAGIRVATETEAEVTSANRAAVIPAVRTVAAQRLSGSVPLELPGSIEPIEVAAINARASGYVAKRLVDIGQNIKAADVMAIIRSTELDQQVSQAEAALNQARANLELAHATAQRSGTLVKQGWVTAQKFDDDRLTENARAAEVRAAEAALAAIAQRRDYLTVAAPFNGIVTARNVETGDLVSADTTAAKPLFSLARIDRVKVQVHVPQDVADGLQKGIAVSVTVPELRGESFKGIVARTAHALDSTSRTLLVEVDIDNPGNKLTPGTYTNVRFDLMPPRPRVHVDANALIYGAQGLKVAVIENDRVRLVPVVIGRDFGAEVEITEGLAGGEMLVLNPSAALQDGKPVRIAAK
jgi:RND family efflux transporter MFP subunit